MGPDAMILVFRILSFKSAFSLSSSFHSPLSRGSLLPLCFLSLSSVICISEIIDISPGNLDSILCFIQSSISYDVHCIKLNKQGDNYTALTYSFPLIWNQSIVPCPVLTIASWPAYRFLRRQVRWSCISIFWRIFQFLVIHSQRLLCSQWSRPFSGTLFLFLWSSGCWQFDLWFLCLF